MALASLAATNLPLVLLSGAIGLLAAAWWSVMLPRLALWLLFGSVVAGQLIRIQVAGQGGGLLASDLAVGFTIIAGVVSWRRYKNRFADPFQQKGAQLAWLVLPFIGWSLFTLVIHAFSLESHQLVIAGLYWVRTSAYLLLFPALAILMLDPINRTTIRHGLFFTVAGLVMLGIVQVILLSDLSFLSQYGWDPHQRRLVSTWLDPNFIGAFLVVALPWVLAQWSTVKKNVLWRSGYTSLVVLQILAIALTQSRSSLVAFLGIFAIAVPYITWKMAARIRSDHARLLRLVGIIGMCVVWGALAAGLLGDRLAGFVQYDPTVTLRTDSLALAWSHIIQPNALVGVGYNAYQFAAVDAGLIGQFSLHSRAGADNSWLTLWATTGLIGVLLFAWPWIAAGIWLGRKAVKGLDLQAGAGVLALAGLFIHSQFVNSFLYAHLLVILVAIVTISMQPYDRR
ncbi:MAG: O-antigen ligase family protein [Candidatus Andersenbacteria bacterium]